MKCANCNSDLVKETVDRWVYDFCPVCHHYWQEKKLKLCHEYRRPDPDCAVLSLAYEPSKLDHHDVLLKLNGIYFRSDSYYYLLECDAAKSMLAMLQQWKKDLLALQKGDVVFLPHAFFDQETVWIRATLTSASTVELVNGWSRIEGYAFYPSQYMELEKGPTDFKPLDYEKPVNAELAQVIADIDCSIAAIEELG